MLKNQFYYKDFDNASAYVLFRRKVTGGHELLGSVYYSHDTVKKEDAKQAVKTFCKDLNAKYPKIRVSK